MICKCSAVTILRIYSQHPCPPNVDKLQKNSQIKPKSDAVIISVLVVTMVLIAAYVA